MGSDRWLFASVAEISTAVREGKVSALEVTNAALERIEATDHRLRAFRHVDAEGARATASELDTARRSGVSLGALAGVPIAVKENIPVNGLPREVGSLVRRGERSDSDALAVGRLRSAHGVVIGMTCMPEYGHIGLGHSPLGPATRNPWSMSHTPGGSSSGSAVAVASGQAALALGTDGGGSIRIPSACCGVVGHKPTLGRVPHAPLRAGFSPMSHLGPIGRSVGDVAMMLDVIAGQDHSDPASLPSEGVCYAELSQESRSEGRIAWAPQLGTTTVDHDVLQVCLSAIEALEANGYTVVEIDPFLDDWTDAWAILFDVMMASLVVEHLSDIYRLSEPSLIARVEHGHGTKAIELAKAEATRRDVWAAFHRIYEKFDVIVTPALLGPPLPVDPQTGEIDDPEVWSDRWFMHMYPANLTGQPASSVPVGTTVDGLPVGLQVMGSRFADGMVITFASAVERCVDWLGTRPEVD